MEFESIIFKSELEFRNYVVQNIKDISKIIVFEDILENNLYFYCFINESIIVGTKEQSIKRFDFYKEIYQSLTKEWDFNTIPEQSQFKILKLVKHQ